ncbi:AraC family transcriptional regulator [Thalassoroseus pseudoceratinae]|uniref:AraC family transcriptional regulator n=1 Tax=Thalassoroseus pseudoceratinae TaxID=2713176 RepID=UPI001420D72F|nr:AraC family transcriptional regulator [Thalassoroseus pseudoceratinae]
MDSIQHFLNELEPPFTGEALFDCLSDVVFFIKDACGRYIVVNQTVVDRCGFRSKDDLIGRTASQVFRAPLGESYETQDRVVLQSGRPLTMQLELHIYPARDVGWCLTNKMPLRRKDGDIAGLVGISQDLRLPDSSIDEYKGIATAIRYAENNLASPPSVQDLAEVAGMSRYQLDRRIRRVFGLTAGQWLMKLRIDHAQQSLQETDISISQIALEAGYTDQSAFTRQFRQATGLSPREFRQAFHRRSIAPMRVEESPQ